MIIKIEVVLGLLELNKELDMSIEKVELEARLKYAKTLIGIYKKEVESLKEEIEKIKKN